MANTQQLVERKLARETEVLGNFLKCHFVHHKSHTFLPGIYPGLAVRRRRVTYPSSDTAVFYSVTPCSLVNVCQCFGETCCPEAKGDTFLWSSCKYPSDYTTSYPLKTAVKNKAIPVRVVEAYKVERYRDSHIFWTTRLIVGGKLSSLRTGRVLHQNI
jgi:hypothetical protein